MSDVALRNTADGGDICVEQGIVTLDGGLESAVYLSLFGGNSDDPGRRSSNKTWWNNLNETDENRKQRSRTQNLLRSLPALPFNLRKLEDAVRDDLAWFVEEGAATSVDAAASLIGRNRVKLVITIDANDEKQTIKFIENWKVDA